jgi:hypothetical protein
MESVPNGSEELVLRGSRRGTVAALGAGVLFVLVTVFFLAAGSVLAAAVAALLALVGLGAGIAGLVPGAASLRLDSRGYAVTSPVKSWRVGWGEIDHLERAEVPAGPNGTTPVVKVVFREGSERAHLPQTLLAKLRPDEHYVYPAYGNLDVDRLLALLEQWQARHGPCAVQGP